ncbi:MAG TPA: transposase [Streptosporangiaceae bacterium]
MITTLNAQVKILEEQVREHFGRHPDAEIYQSQPGLAAILGARVLGEFGDDPRRYLTAKARKNYGGTSPITRASGKKKVVAARFIHNDRLVDALMSWAFSSLKASPGARAFYDEQRAKGHDHSDALRRLANRLAGILHGCLKTPPPGGGLVVEGAAGFWCGPRRTAEPRSWQGRCPEVTSCWPPKASRTPRLVVPPRRATPPKTLLLG